MSNLLKIHSSHPTGNDEKLLVILLLDKRKFNTIPKQNILMCNLKFIKDSRRFDNSLF